MHCTCIIVIKTPKYKKDGQLHMKKLTVFIATLALLLVACSSDSNNDQHDNNDDVNVAENASDNYVNNNSEVKTGSFPSNAHDDEENGLSPNEILEILDNSFIDFDVEYNGEDKAFIFDSTDEAFTKLVVGLTNGDYGDEKWEVYPENLIEISQMVTMGENEHDYTFVIRNPANSDSLILIIMDDEVMYDFTDDI